MSSDHPVARLIASYAVGDVLPPDGSWQRVEPWRHHLEAIIAFTGRAVLAISPGVPDDELVALGVDGFGVVPAGELVVAAVAPGNAASLRAVLSAGFTPVESMQLFRRDARAGHTSSGTG